MTLDMSFDQLSTNATRMAVFKLEYSKALAASLGLSANKVQVTDVVSGSVIVTSNILVSPGTPPTAIEDMVGVLRSGTALSQEFRTTFGIAGVVGALVSGPAAPAAVTTAGRSKNTVTIAAAVGATGGAILMAAVVAYIVIHRWV
jgi:hypothetical protein